MSTYKVGITVGGTTHYLPFAEHEWVVQSGFFAPVQAWLMPTETADAIMTALEGLTGVDREVTLLLGEPAAPITVSRVIVLGTAPADNPQRRNLLLTDVRWYFTRAWFVMDVNVRRRLGDTRLVGGSLVESVVVDQVAYAPWSINNETTPEAYDWEALKEHVLTALTEERHGRPELFFVTDTFTVIATDAKIVQETTTDSPGHIALARAIESIPGAGIYVSLDGVIHVHETTPSAEISAVEALPAALQGHGDLVLVDNSGRRPDHTSEAAWRIYVDYELEVRFDYDYTLVGIADSGPQDPFLVPVLQVTDRQLTIPAGTYHGLGTVAERTVGQGSWITQDEAFAAWGGITYGVVTLPQLTDDIVARHWFGDGLDRYTVGNLTSSYDPVWGARIDELVRCYRTYFRVNPKFWERIRRAWAIRAAIWDPVTGTRAPAPVFCNFCIIPVNRPASAEITDIAFNVEDRYDPVLGLGRPSGFRVKIADQELGVLAIDRNVLSRYPGHAKIGISPVVEVAKINDGILDGMSQELQPADEGSFFGWKLAVVLSVSPAAPNDMRRMFEIKVTTNEAKQAAGLIASAPAGYGPEIERRSRLAEARVPYLEDEDPPMSLQILGLDDATWLVEYPEGELEVTPINLDQELIPLARAIAAADLLSKLDHYEGTKAVPMDGDIVPVGSISKVVHKVLENRAVTIVQCPGDPPQFSAIDFLDASARKFLVQEIPAAQR